MGIFGASSPGIADYSASKAAAVAFNEVVRKEILKKARNPEI